jgi:hypothetical protein
MEQIGYIIQYFDDEKFTPQQGGKILYRKWDDVIRAATAAAEAFQKERDEEIEGPFSFPEIEQEWTNLSGSSIFFTSRDVTIWIEVVYEN